MPSIALQIPVFCGLILPMKKKLGLKRYAIKCIFLFLKLSVLVFEEYKEKYHLTLKFPPPPPPTWFLNFDEKSFIIVSANICLSVGILLLYSRK